jgi:hypothetical protein
MKKLIAIIAVLVGIQAAAQNLPPQAINFQGVAIDKNGIPVPGIDELGNPIQNAGIKVRFSILEGSATGVATYREVHETTTDEFGRFNLEIGRGSNVEGVFQDIQWGSNRHFLKVEVDLGTAGSNYQLASIQEFLSVPYALYARASKSSDDDLDMDPTNELQTLTITNDTVLSIANGNAVTLPTSVGPQGLQGIQGIQGDPGADGRSVLNGSANPTSGIGANGDFYINTSTNTLFGPKSSGVWPSGVSLVGPAGPIGQTGPIGLTGPTGLTGAPGPAGANGTNGSAVLSGISNPATSLGANGDFYINTSTNTLFGPKSSGVWPSGVSLVGPAGPNGQTGPAGAPGPAGANGTNGSTVLSGISNPATSLGANGDFYINTSTNTLFGPKSGGVWPSGVSLVGPAGPIGQTGPIGLTGPTGLPGAPGPAGANGTNGSTVLSGISNPATSLGANGDFYINTNTNTLFGPKSSGVWPSGVSLVGPQGILPPGSINGNTPYWDGTSWVINNSNLFNNGSQVAVNTGTPNAAAILEVSSTTKGVLFPRMTKVQRQAIITPPVGLLVFQTDAPLGFYYFDGTHWVFLTGSSSVGTDPNTLIYTVNGF